MTLIVSPKVYTSKAALKKALDEGCLIYEPSIMGEWTKNSCDLPIGFHGVVTNHPVRSKFAEISKTATGWKVS